MKNSSSHHNCKKCKKCLKNSKNKHLQARNKRRNFFLAFFLLMLFFTATIITGVLGFGRYFNLGWIDSFHNSAMYIAGVGPITVAQTDTQKLFAGSYALVSGVLFLSLGGFLLALMLSIAFFDDLGETDSLN